jgi:putative ABC transport system permease protein
VAISGMMYRMKQHAAGLASICILSTMALITIAMTASLYFGRQAELDAEYAYDITFTPSIKMTTVQDATYELAEKMNIQITDSLNIKTFQAVPYGQKDGQLTWVSDSDVSFSSAAEFISATYYRFISLDEYNYATNSTYSLKKDEVMVDQLGSKTNEKEIHFKDSQTFKVVKNTNRLAPIFQEIPLPTVLLVFSNEEQIKRVLEETIPEITEDSQIIEKEYRWSFNFVEDDRKQRLNFVEDFTKIVNESSLNSQRSYSYSLKTKDVAIESAHVFDGSFFFIGLLLSIVFMLATTLIIYFKQISEGLEDRRRFIIMQKVGMSQQEVKKTIHQQVIMVFSLPLIVALSHVVFAFPMMKQLLLLFEITQSDIFVKATISVVLCFILLYLVVYSLTAKIYYHLVEREI